MSYTALDVLSGISAGQVYLNTHPGMVMGHHTMSTMSSPGINSLLSLGGTLGHIGAGAFIAVCLLVAVWHVKYFSKSNKRLQSIIGSIIIMIASITFYDSHIYWPHGVLAMLAFAFAIGFGLLWHVQKSSLVH